MRSARLTDESTKRQVAFVMKVASCLATERSFVKTTMVTVEVCHPSLEEDSDAGSLHRRTTTKASVTATTAMVRIGRR